MTKLEALQNELNTVECKIWNIEMADYIRGTEKIQYDALRNKRTALLAEIRAITEETAVN